jgi:tripartite-type tricarboxylate transporter receptor subunit TctC
MVSAASGLIILPDAPTMTEAGFPTLSTGAWTALMAPRGGTPNALADHIANETKKWKPIVEALNLKAD